MLGGAGYGCSHDWGTNLTPETLPLPDGGVGRKNLRRDPAVTSASGSGTTTAGVGGGGGDGAAGGGGVGVGAGAGGGIGDVPCDGMRLNDACWYVSDFGQSCDAACASHGGASDRIAALVGTPAQGGSIEVCQTILHFMGIPGQVNWGYRDDGLGLGCHIWEDGSLWWLDHPDVDTVSSVPPARRVCACAR